MRGSQAGLERGREVCPRGPFREEENSRLWTAALKDPMSRRPLEWLGGDRVVVVGGRAGSVTIKRREEG